MPDTSEQVKKAAKYGLILLRFRPRSVSEFRQRLALRGFSRQVCDEVISDFKKRGLLDDARFAKVWLSQPAGGRPKGALRLKAELQGKGLSQDQIDGALRGLSRDSEYDAARLAAEKRARSLSGLDALTAKRRLAAFLERRGFSDEIITKTVKDIL